MKAAIIGTGNIANSHAEALRSSGIELVAAVDIHPENAETFAKRWNVPDFGTDPSILFKKDIDSVHICTPPTLHYEMAKQLIEHGKHVLCEKPLCLDENQAYQLAEKADRSKVITAVGLNVRYSPAIIRAKEIIQSDDFGSIHYVRGCYLQQFGILPSPHSWRFNKILAGEMRAITEIGTHWLDLVQHLSGSRIKRVSAIIDTVHPTRFVENGLMYEAPISNSSQQIKVDSEDIAMIHLQLSNGSFGSVILSQVSHGRVNHLEIEITGDKKSLWWNSEIPTELYSATKANGIVKEIFAFGNNGFIDSIRNLVRDYYMTIANGKRNSDSNLPTFFEGAYLSAVCNAIYKSAVKGGVWETIPNNILSEYT